FVLLFSPITFPADQLPQWFQLLHDQLPIRPAADLLRAGIAAQSFTAELRDLVVLVAWTALGLVVTARALVRRRCSQPPRYRMCERPSAPAATSRSRGSQRCASGVPL